MSVVNARQMHSLVNAQRLLLVERAAGDTRREMPTIGVPAATGLQQAQRGALNDKSGRRRRAGRVRRYERFDRDGLSGIVLEEIEFQRLNLYVTCSAIEFQGVTGGSSGF